MDNLQVSESCSSTAVELLQCRHVWKVENFIHCQEELLVSPPFSVGEGEEKIEWELRLYPNGGGIANNGYLSVYFKLRSAKGGRVKARIDEVTIILESNGRERLLVSKKHGKYYEYSVGGGGGIARV